MLGLIIYLLIVGIVAGFLARLLVPGPDPMSFWETVVLGVVGSFIGGFLGYILFGKDLDEGAPAVGRTIRNLDLRKRSGATVIAVSRGGDAEINPGPEFALAPGDAVVLLGSPEQIDAAVEQLAGAAARAAGSDS